MDAIVMRKHFESDIEKLTRNELLLQTRNWKIIKCEFPEFIVSMQHPITNKTYGFYFLCDDYPISMKIVDPTTLLVIPNCLNGGNFIPHPKLNRPFLCIPGLREYHTHPSHENETQWTFPNNKFRLPQLIDNVYAHFIQAR